MLILIVKDGATKVPKECTPVEAQAFAREFPVLVLGDDNSETPFAEWLEANPIEEETPEDTAGESDAYIAAELAAFTKSGMSKSKWNKLKKDEREALIQAELPTA